MIAITHVLAEVGWECAYCGEPIPPNDAQQALWQPGDRIGVLLSKWADPVSYGVGQHDSNPRCSPVPCVDSKTSSTGSTSSATPSRPNASAAD